MTEFGNGGFPTLRMWDSDDLVVTSYAGSRWLRWLAIVSCVMTGFTVGLVAASESLARVPSRPFENKGLAIVNGGVLQARDGELLLEGPHFGIRRLWQAARFKMTSLRQLVPPRFCSKTSSCPKNRTSWRACSRTGYPRSLSRSD